MAVSTSTSRIPGPRAVPPRPQLPTARRRGGPQAILALQAAAGNRATARLLHPRLAAPRAAVERRLVARQSVTLPCPPPHLSEADRAATLAALCMGDASLFTGDPVVELSGHERRLVMATLWEARSRAARAANNLSRGDDYMSTLAARFFHEENLDQRQLASTAQRIHQALQDTPFERGTCANQLCTNEVDGRREGSAIMADADVDHVTHATDTITICPFFFDPSHSLPELVRTWLHEAGHIARIDDPPPGQPYEHPPNCETQRGGLPGCTPPVDAVDACPGGNVGNVDNWAYFVDHAANA